MQYTAVITLAVAAIAAARPNEALVSGSDQNISIYAFGDAGSCHHTLRDFGACGISTFFKNVNQDASFVAMPSGVFDRYGSGQHNRLCGKTITITKNGVTKTAIVADRNVSVDNSIDTCLDIWTAFGRHDGDGTLIHGATWNIDGV